MNPELAINLETGETMEVDAYRVMALGMPEGFRYINSITTDNWIAALRLAIAKLEEAQG